MVNTAVKVSAQTNHLTYILTGDGTQVGPTVANATILADMVPGPLRDAWNETQANQAAMRNTLLGGLPTSTGGGACHAIVQLLTSGKDVTAEINQITVDVDTDAVSVTKPEINIAMSDTTGQIAMLHLIHRHSLTE